MLNHRCYELFHVQVDDTYDEEDEVADAEVVVVRDAPSGQHAPRGKEATEAPDAARTGGGKRVSLGGPVFGGRPAGGRGRGDGGVTAVDLLHPARGGTSTMYTAVFGQIASLLKKAGKQLPTIPHIATFVCIMGSMSLLAAVTAA